MKTEKTFDEILLDNGITHLSGKQHDDLMAQLGNYFASQNKLERVEEWDEVVAKYMQYYDDAYQLGEHRLKFNNWCREQNYQAPVDRRGEAVESIIREMQSLKYQMNEGFGSDIEPQTAYLESIMVAINNLFTNTK